MKDPNAAQRDYWNGPGGQNWVANQAELDALMAGITEALLDEVAPMPGSRILDVGCGAGETTIALARAVAPGGSVTGIDLSEPLLALARERGEARAICGTSPSSTPMQPFTGSSRRASTRSSRASA